MSWSEHDLRVVRTLADEDPKLVRRFEDRYANARAFAEYWRNIASTTVTREPCHGCGDRTSRTTHRPSRLGHATECPSTTTLMARLAWKAELNWPCGSPGRKSTSQRLVDAS